MIDALVGTIRPPVERPPAGNVSLLEANYAKPTFCRPCSKNNPGSPNPEPNYTDEPSDDDKEARCGTNNDFDGVAIHAIFRWFSRKVSLPSSSASLLVKNATILVRRRPGLRLFCPEHPTPQLSSRIISVSLLLLALSFVATSGNGPRSGFDRVLDHGTYLPGSESEIRTSLERSLPMGTSLSPCQEKRVSSA